MNPGLQAEWRRFAVSLGNAENSIGIVTALNPIISEVLTCHGRSFSCTFIPHDPHAQEGHSGG
jgi:hypothetical protein